MPTVAQATASPHSGVLTIDALLKDTVVWNYLTPTRTTIYYAFAVTDDPTTDEIERRLPDQAQVNARLALAEMTKVTGIQFMETSPGQADIYFSTTDLGPSIAGLCATQWNYRADSRGNLTSLTMRADIYLDDDYVNRCSPGQFGFETLLHEVGHAMGLKHPFDDDVTLPSALDSTNWTVMSYTDGSEGYQSTYQEFDVAALQFLYGTDGLGGASGIVPAADGFTANEKTVLYLYDTIFNGLPSAAAFRSYVDQLDSGISKAALAKTMITEAGIFSLGRDDLLDTFYRNVGGNDATTEQVSAARRQWHNLTPEEVAVRIAESDAEVAMMAAALDVLQDSGYPSNYSGKTFSQAETEVFYLYYLANGEMPDANAFLTYASSLKSGTDATTVAADIIADSGLSTASRRSFLDSLYINMSGSLPTEAQRAEARANWDDAMPEDVLVALVGTATLRASLQSDINAYAYIQFPDIAAFI